MAVDQGVHLVDAGARLVDALRIERDRLLGARRTSRRRSRRRPAGRSQCGDVARPRRRQRRRRGRWCAARRSRCATAPRRCSSASRPLNSATSLPGLSARCRSAMSQVSVRRGSITTTFMSRPRALGRLEALEQHRMAPGEIAADQHHEIGQLEILVEARHGVAAEGALVAGHRRGHAEPRIGVDVGGAEEAFDQLVGGVIVLGQQLARDVEGHGIRPVPGDDLAKALRHGIERARPTTRDGRRSRDGAAGLRATASRPAPRPWSRAGRDWPDGPDRPRSRRRPARPASR